MLRHRLYVLELFSGHGTVAKYASAAFEGCSKETVDIDPATGASICLDILSWTAEDSRRLQERHAGGGPQIRSCHRRRRAPAPALPAAASIPAPLPRAPRGGLRQARRHLREPAL